MPFCIADSRGLKWGVIDLTSSKFPQENLPSLHHQKTPYGASNFHIPQREFQVFATFLRTSPPLTALEPTSIIKRRWNSHGLKSLYWQSSPLWDSERNLLHNFSDVIHYLLVYEGSSVSCLLIVVETLSFYAPLPSDLSGAYLVTSLKFFCTQAIVLFLFFFLFFF